MLHMTRLFASNNISQMSVSARYKQNRREASEEGAGAALHPGKDYTSGYPGNNRSTWRYGHYAETFRHMPMPICLHI